MRPIRIYNDELLEGANGLPAIAGMIRHVIEHFDQYLHMVDPLTHTVVVPVFDVPDEASAPVVGAAGVWQVTTPAADLPGDQWLVVIDTGTGTVDFMRQPAEHGHGQGHE